ncbi:hypothetical protein LguiA_035269 [Lonicera macranthoides]
MNRRLRRSTSTSSIDKAYLRYLKPGALAQLRDSRINARSSRLDSKSQINLRRTPSPSSSPLRSPDAGQAPTEAFPCFAARIFGPRCPQRKKLVASKSVFFVPSNPVMDSPDNPIIDLFTTTTSATDFLLSH